MAKARKVDIVRGLGKFLDANHVEVALTTALVRKRPAKPRSSNSRSASSPPARRP